MIRIATLQKIKIHLYEVADEKVDHVSTLEGNFAEGEGWGCEEDMWALFGNAPFLNWALVIGPLLLFSKLTNLVFLSMAYFTV